MTYSNVATHRLVDYDLKTVLLQNLQPSIAIRPKGLLSKEELGDEKPTELLHRMK